jgi:hypothetical protein
MFLLFSFDREPILGLVHNTSPSLTVSGVEYFIVGPPDDGVLFYDWLVGTDGHICGISIHCVGEYSWEREWRRAIRQEREMFVRILFNDPQENAGFSELGLEAFGDIYIYACCERTKWLVLVGLDQWIGEKHRQELLAAATLR